VNTCPYTSHFNFAETSMMNSKVISYS